MASSKRSDISFPDRCESSVEHFKKELAKARSGRASAGILDSLTVEYYGSPVPLKQLAVINAPEPRLLTVQAYDAQSVSSIEKAILQSDLGLNPSRDGNLIRINIPPLTESRRKDLVKMVHKMAEEAKIAIRSHRRDEIDELKAAQKKGDISEDDFYREQDKVQQTTDRFVKQVDELLAEKEKEMLEV